MSISALAANAWPTVPLPPALLADDGTAQAAAQGAGARGSLPPVQAAASSASGNRAKSATADTAKSGASAGDDTPSATRDTAASAQAGGTGAAPSTGKSGQSGQLTEAQLRVVDQLKARDREVRQHEAAHQAAGGAFVGGASFTYERGPDGQNYAIGGEVSVDSSAISGDPRQTIAKMRRIQAAALAPADPSPQDRHVAAQAQQTMLKAQQELLRTSSAKAQGQQTGSGQQAVQAYAGTGTDAAANTSRHVDAQA